MNKNYQTIIKEQKERIKKQKEREHQYIKYVNKMILVFAYSITYITDKYPEMGVNLSYPNNFCDHVLKLINAGKFDKVSSDLYTQYESSDSHISPELNIILHLVASAFNFMKL